MSLNEQLKRLLFHDEPAVPVTASRSGSYSTDKSKERSTQVLPLLMLEFPRLIYSRFSTPFIQHDAVSPKSDPFGTPTRPKANSVNKLATPATLLGMKHERDNDWRARKPGHENVPSTPPCETPSLISDCKPTTYHGFGYGNDSAQALYPPNCCVFIAK